MADLGINQNYYAVSTEKAPETEPQNHNLASVKVNGGGEGITYYCSAKISIEFLETEDGTNNLKDKLKAGDLFGKLSSSNNSLNITFDLSNYVGNKYIQYIDFNLTGTEGQLDITGDIYLVNKTSEQNYLSNAKLKANIIIDELECDLKEKELKAKPKLCSTSGLEQITDSGLESAYTDGTYTYIHGQDSNGDPLENETSWSVTSNASYEYLKKVIELYEKYPNSSDEEDEDYNLYNQEWGQFEKEFTEKYSNPITESPCTEIDEVPITSAADMFEYNPATFIDISNWDTSLITNVQAMFFGVQTTRITLPENFGSAVTNMRWMFEHSVVEEINLNNMDTSNATEMALMFSEAQIPTLDLTNFTINNETDIYMIFFDCTATTVYVKKDMYEKFIEIANESEFNEDYIKIK